MDVGIEQHVEGHVLLEVSRADPPGAIPRHPQRRDLPMRRVVAAEGRVPWTLPVAQNDTRVGVDVGGEGELRGVDGVALAEDVDESLVGVEGERAREEFGDVESAPFVVLRLEPQRVGADAQVGVHRDEDDLAIGLRVTELEGGAHDGVIHLPVVALPLQLVGLGHLEDQLAAVPELDPILERAVRLAQVVESAREMTCVPSALAQLLLELIDLLDDVDRDDDGVLFEFVDRLRIVDEDVGIEDEDFGCVGHGREASHRRGFRAIGAAPTWVGASASMDAETYRPVARAMTGAASPPTVSSDFLP